MKNFKVSVHRDKVDFFKQLLDSLAFVHYEDLEIEPEVRVYPGASFEIRSKKSKQVNGEGSKSNFVRETQGSGVTTKDALADIREAMSQINKLRDKL